jgi:hypothetical protein
VLVLVVFWRSLKKHREERERERERESKFIFFAL